jgi:putative NIF3 family GTP cyclohydrolase 1 type 2
MKAKDIALIIEEFAPLGTQEPWDNSGFCIGSPEQEIKGVMIGFDCTPELIEAAVAADANMIITHHPLIFFRHQKDQSRYFYRQVYHSCNYLRYRHLFRAY